MRLALIEDEPTQLTQQLAMPIEHALRAAGKDAALTAVEEVSCSFAGRDHQFLLPRGIGAPDTSDTSDAVALESDSEVAFVYPPNDGLVDAIVKTAEDPTTFRRPNSLRLAQHDAEASSAALGEGETLFTFRALLDRPATGRWRTALAAYYRLRWKGKDEAVFVLSRTYGGLGRLAEAADQEREKGPWVGVARGGTFGSAISDVQGRAAADALERAGLDYSAVSASEIEHWGELLAYRRERPKGVKYLSANIVYSTAAASVSTTTVSTTTATVLPPYAVFDAAGTRVALVGLTPGWTDKILAQAGVKGLTVKDPVSTLEALIPRLRREADVVVALGALGEADMARLSSSAHGLDLLVGDDAPFMNVTPPPKTVTEQEDRPAFGNPLPTVRVVSPALNMIEIERKDDGDRANWKVAQRATILDDSINPQEGFPEPALEAYAAGRSTAPPVLPPAREVLPLSAGRPSFEGRDFWTLAAGLLAERGDGEAGLLPVKWLTVLTVGAVPESLVRAWLKENDVAVRVSVPGADLKKLADEAADQKRREDADLPPTGRLRFVVSGFDPRGLIHGAPLAPAGIYHLTTSRSAAEALGLPGPYEVIAGTPTVAALVLAGLRSHVGAPAAAWRSWIGGAPVSTPGLWRINFRDISLNIRHTKTDASIDFANVVNTRVQSADEVLVGGVIKTDAEYLRGDYKWTNTLEMEYAQDRIAPNGQPATTNLSSNRIMLLTLGTRKVGTVSRPWLAESWGPELGLEYDSQFAPVPGLPLKDVVSVFPGVELFDGKVVKSLELTGVVKRDLSRIPPNTQTGARARAVVSTPLGPNGAKLDGEFWNNYFFLTSTDNSSDLRVEGDLNAKLNLPVRKYLSISPFVDFYWFELKVQPVWGYSIMSGISIGFSRVWKPQYESF